MRISLHRSFEKKFTRLDENVRKKFKERKNLFLENPFNPILNNHSVEKRFPGCRSINITGDYRAIFKTKEATAIFINIGSHSDLYS